MAYGFDISTIDPYVNQTATGLISAAVLGGDTMDFATIVPGIKGSQSINYLEDEITINFASCGFTPDGETSITQRDIEVKALEVKKQWCEKDLEPIFLGQMMKPGAPKDPQFGDILANRVVELIKKENEKQLWVGGLGSPAYGKIDGYVAILSSEADRVDCTSLSPAIDDGPYTASNIVETVDFLLTNLPEEIAMREDLCVFMSMGNFKLYTAALRTAALLPAAWVEDGNFEITIPGTNVKAKAQAGLTGTDYMILTFKANLIVGTDLLHEEEKFDIWYSRDNDELRGNFQFKLGAQVYFPAFCVTNF